MAKLSDHEDDLTQAALLTEEQEKEDAKAEAASEAKASSSAKSEDAPEQETDESTPTPKPPEAKDAPEVEEAKETEEEETPPEPKPESKKDDEPAEPKTRKEKRKERQERFLDKIQREAASKKTPVPPVEPHTPLDYNKPETFSKEDGFIKPEVLAEDREKFGEAKLREGQQAAAFAAEQEKFWDMTIAEKELLSKDPEFSFLDPESDDYDPEREGRLSEVFLGLSGYEEIPVTNEQGQALADPQTGQPLVRRLVKNTNNSFKNFAREWIADQKRYAEEAVDRTAKNISAQKARSGIRPGGESRKTKTFSLQDIASMTPEELEENNDAIMAQAEEMSHHVS